MKWNQFNGNWLISSSRDHLCKLFDIRNLKEEIQSFRGHKKDACSKKNNKNFLVFFFTNLKIKFFSFLNKKIIKAVSWHPIYEKLFASGGADGSIFFWLVG